MAHSRKSSATNVPKQESTAPKQAPKRQIAAQQTEIRYTALIRLPFPRGDFVDPPQVDWDATKDKALWKIISQSPKTSDLDCGLYQLHALLSPLTDFHIGEELATRFDVSPAFMLQQAAWLYERHLSHVRAQMRKVGTSNAPVPAQTSSGTVNTAPGGVPMKRGGSAGSGASRLPSAMSVRSRESPTPRGDTNPPDTPVRANAPPLSRNPSTTTVTQSRVAQSQPPSPRPVQHSFRGAYPSTTSRQPSKDKKLEAPVEDDNEATNSPSAGSDPSDSDSSSESDIQENPIRRSQIFKRPPRFNQQKRSPRLGTVDDVDDDDKGDDDDDEDSSEGLPFAKPPSRPWSGQPDPTATIRQQQQQQHPVDHDDLPAKPSTTEKGKQPALPPPAEEPSDTSSPAHSLSSADAPPQHQAQPSPSTRPSRTGPSTAGPLSPRHRAELARLNSMSPRSKGKREGSDGTPSMGSSFSDLEGMCRFKRATLVPSVEGILVNMANDRTHRYFYHPISA